VIWKPVDNVFWIVKVPSGIVIWSELESGTWRGWAIRASSGQHPSHHKVCPDKATSPIAPPPPQRGVDNTRVHRVPGPCSFLDGDGLRITDGSGREKGRDIGRGHHESGIAPLSFRYLI
jgi:hypothetical protein